VPFGGFVDIAPHFGREIPKTQIFASCRGVFKPNEQNSKSFILSKLLHRLQPNFANDRDQQVVIVGGLNTHPTNPRQRHLENNKKSRYLRNGLTDLYEIW